MRAKEIEDLKIGDEILVDFPRNFMHNFSILKVVEIDLEENFIISNLNGGLEIHPNEDDQYIVLDKLES